MVTQWLYQSLDGVLLPNQNARTIVTAVVNASDGTAPIMNPQQKTAVRTTVTSGRTSERTAFILTEAVRPGRSATER